MPRPLKRLAAVVLAGVSFLTGSVVTAVSEDDLRPSADLEYVIAEPGDSWWGIWEDLALGGCTHTDVWAFNGGGGMLVGQKVEIPPFCVVGGATTTTTSTSTLPPTTTSTTTSTTTTTLPPAVPPPLVGATIDVSQNPSGCSNHAACYTQFNTQIGGGLEIIRAFTGSFPSSFTSVNSFAASAPYHRVLSVKGSPSQAQWVTFLNTIPNNGKTTWIAIHHEPENDGGTMTPATFKARQAILHAAWVQIGRPAHIRPTVIFMSWHERDNDPNTSTALWFPANIQDFTLGLDPYTGGATPLADIVDDTLELWEEAGGGDWMITETGAKATGSALVAWIDDAWDWCRADDDCVSIQWFHSAVGSSGPWWLPTGAGSTAWGDQAGVPRP